MTLFTYFTYSGETCQFAASNFVTIPMTMNRNRNSYGSIRPTYIKLHWSSSRKLIPPLPFFGAVLERKPFPPRDRNQRHKVIKEEI